MVLLGKGVADPSAGIMLTYHHLFLVLVFLTSPFVTEGVRTLNNEPFIGCLDERDSINGNVISVQCRGVTGEFVANHLSQLSVDEIIEVDLLHCKLSILWSFNQTISRIRIVDSDVTEIVPDSFRSSTATLAELDLSNNRLNKFPGAVQNLTELETLDLSNNNITTLPEGTQFFHLWKLRHLNLAHNRLGVIQDIQERAYRDFGKPLSLTVFNIEPLREILETLNLRGNKLKVLPEQFSRRFSRLRTLDISNNYILEIPADAFSNMPDLQFLNLDNNRLQFFQLATNPPELRVLSFLGNPLSCECKSIVLKRLVVSNNTWHNYHPCITLNSTEIRELKVITDDEDICRTIIPSNRVVIPPSAEDKPMNSKSPAMLQLNSTMPVGLQLELESSSRAVHVTWKANRTGDEKTGFSWRIVSRKFGTKNFTEVTGTQSSGAEASGTVTFQTLLPSTGYSVCFEYSSNETERQRLCEEILTSDEDLFPSAEVAVAATVSTTSTVIVIALICCCCPCKKCKKKEEKIPESVINNNNSNKAEYSYPSLSMKYENLSEGYKRNCVLFPEDFSYTNFSAINSAEKDEESRRVFEETRKYLQTQRLKATLNHDAATSETVKQNEVKVDIECHEKEDSTSSGYLTPKTNDEIDATLNFDLFKPKDQDKETIISPEVIQKRLSIVESLQNFKEPMPKLPISLKKRHSIELSEIQYKRPAPPRVVGATFKRTHRNTWSAIPVVPPTIRWNTEAYEKFLANPSIYKRKRRHTLYHAPPYMTVNRLYLVAHPGGEVQF